MCLGLFPRSAGRPGKASCAVLAGILARRWLTLLLVHALLQSLFLFLLLTAGGVVVLRRIMLHGSRGVRRVLLDSGGGGGPPPIDSKKFRATNPGGMEVQIKLGAPPGASSLAQI